MKKKKRKGAKRPEKDVKILLKKKKNKAPLSLCTFLRNTKRS